MLGEFIFEKMTTIRQIDIVGEKMNRSQQSFTILDPIPVSHLNMENLPFVIVRAGFYLHNSFYLLNTETCTYELLVKLENIKKQGFCITLPDGNIDFHFSHIVTGDDKSKHEQHHHICFRTDIIDWLMKNKRLPTSNLADCAKLFQTN
jgi:hypothetical protein